MRTCPIEQIIIPENRARREFNLEHLAALRSSIIKLGLQNPIVLRHDTEMSLVLVSGERRLRAITTLHKSYTNFKCDGTDVIPGLIPYTMLSDLPPLQIREAELEENTHRVDLTLQEHAAAIAGLHALRIEQRGEYNRSTGEGQSLSDTSEEITGDRSNATTRVQEMLIINKFRDDPEVASAKTPSEAIRIIKRKVQGELLSALREGGQTTASEHTLIQSRAEDAVQHIGTDSIDCIITDPPYGVGADSFGNQAVRQHAYADTKAAFDSIVELLASEALRVCKQSAHLYLFCDIRHWLETKTILSMSEWKVWPRPMIWDKGIQSGMLPEPNFGPRYCYETILYARLGDRPVTSVYDDVIRDITALHDKDKLGGAEKPVELYKNLLNRSCTPGDSVLDLTCGSGTIFEAARQLNLTAIGIEKDPEQYNIALARKSGLIQRT